MAVVRNGAAVVVMAVVGAGLVEEYRHDYAESLLSWFELKWRRQEKGNC